MRARAARQRMTPPATTSLSGVTVQRSELRRSRRVSPSTWTRASRTARTTCGGDEGRQSTLRLVRWRRPRRGCFKSQCTPVGRLQRSLRAGQLGGRVAPTSPHFCASSFFAVKPR